MRGVVYPLSTTSLVLKQQHQCEWHLWAFPLFQDSEQYQESTYILRSAFQMTTVKANHQRETQVKHKINKCPQICHYSKAVNNLLIGGECQSQSLKDILSN